MDAFGRQKLSTSSPKNPWRFCSKRSDEGFVFFGWRFYDPSLKRWLTPDPAGFADGSNLYAYVRNSPLNRLDLFGLASEDFFARPCPEIFVSFPDFSHLVDGKGLPGKGMFDGVMSDYIMIYENLHKLQFTAEEIKLGKANIFDHVNEIIPANGTSFVWVMHLNGINTSLEEFRESNEAIARKLGGCFLLSRYNPTGGVKADIERVKQERKGIDTPTVCCTRQYLIFACSAVDKINSSAGILDVVHSEGALITKRAIEGMTKEQRDLVLKHLYIYAYGPAEPLSTKQGKSVINFFSEKDYVTGFGPYGHAKDYMNRPDCDIRVLECKSSSSQMNFWIADHGFLMPTYREAWERHIKDLQREIGFYGGSANAQTR
ncbi:MAG: RHS repeat-associated core domain-containing protein [Parachlamydia sp.]|nr:RHS repeat-associated core domain-containing protein [Parachlamydia sp.]